MNKYSNANDIKSASQITRRPFIQKKGERDNFFESKHKKNTESSFSEGLFFEPKLAAAIIQRKENNEFSEEIQQKSLSTFGIDMSSVSVHKDSSQATELGAVAYAQGNDIHFAPGTFNQNSQQGQQLIGHELAHVAQQRQNRVQPTTKSMYGSINESPQLEKEADEMGDRFASSSNLTSAPILPATAGSGTMPAQMLIRERHPWNGAVSRTASLALRDAPRGNTLADLPRRTLVTVLSTSGDWLGLQVDTTQPNIVLNSTGLSSLAGSILLGFAYHRYIDDPAVAEMTSMLGERATWGSSRPGRGNDFDTWASAATESAAPSVVRVTTINCWEMILLAAYRIGAVSWTWIHDLYVNSPTWLIDLPDRLTQGGRTVFDTTARRPYPQRGDLVFFFGAGHVALATGRRDEILTFWPPPNTEFTNGGTVDAVKVSTISALVEYMENDSVFDPYFADDSTPITFGTPVW